MSRKASQREEIFLFSSRFFLLNLSEFYIMYLCYIDESGTSSIPGNTSHFILSGLAIPIEKWKVSEKDIYNLKSKYQLQEAEIHTGWILRPYLEQKQIPDFEILNSNDRIFAVQHFRNKELLRLQKSKKHQLY
jgi:hypothetical protein